MKALKGSFERLGFNEVSTYINSGNILSKSKGGFSTHRPCSDIVCERYNPLERQP
jgi:Protein of unknown function (DUF1697)